MSRQKKPIWVSTKIGEHSGDEVDNFPLKSHTILDVSYALVSCSGCDMVNNPQLNNLPPIKLIPLNDEAVSVVQQQGRRSATKTSLPTDIRWIKVLEFLRSNNLAP